MTDDSVMTVLQHGRPIGALVRERRINRLSWFEGADPRLAAYAGSVDDDAEALAERLARRLGARSASEAGLAVVSVGL
jgi:hypothetical protein